MFFSLQVRTNNGGRLVRQCGLNYAYIHQIKEDKRLQDLQGGDLVATQALDSDRPSLVDPGHGTSRTFSLSLLLLAAVAIAVGVRYRRRL